MTYQERVKHEQVELESKIMKLSEFINGSEIYQGMNFCNQTLLKKQLDSMVDYNEILTCRISLF